MDEKRVGWKGAIARRLLATLGILCLHYLIYVEIGYLASLGEQGYTAPVLLLEALRQPRILALAGLFAAVCAYAWKRLTWERVDPSGCTRWLVMVAAAFQVWIGATYEMNFYFGQEHLTDRLALFVLLALLWRHPVFVYPLVFFLDVIWLQFQYPNFLHTMFLVNKRMAWDALVLFCAYLPVRAAVRLPARYYVYLVLCVIGTFYGVTGLCKLADLPTPTYWLLENQMHNLFLSSYLHGFMSNLSVPTALWAANHLKQFEVAAQAITLLIELSGFVLLLNRRLAIGILTCCIVLHLTILFTSGIMFTFWMLFDLTLVLLLLKAPGRFTRPLFGGHAFKLSLVIMLVGMTMFSPMRFVFLDTPVTNVFWFYGRGASGKVYGLEKNHFALYQGFMTQNAFYYLVKEPVLVETYGTTRSADVYEATLEVTPENYFQVKEQFGRDLYDPQAAAKFSQFIRRWTQNEAAHEESPLLKALIAIGPPYHNNLMVPPANPYRGQEPLVEWEARFLEYLHDGSGLRRMNLTIIPL